VLLRSAKGTGVDGVVIPKHRAVGLTPAVAKTSAGASEHLMIAEVANLRQAIDAVKEKGIWVVATDESGDLLYDGEVTRVGPNEVSFRQNLNDPQSVKPFREVTKQLNATVKP